jgi:hypothetical protein
MLLHNIRQQKQRQKLKKTMMILNKRTKMLRCAIKKKRKAWGRREEEKSEAKFKCLLRDK